MNDIGQGFSSSLSWSNPEEKCARKVLPARTAFYHCNIYMDNCLVLPVVVYRGTVAQITNCILQGELLLPVALYREIWMVYQLESRGTVLSELSKHQSNFNFE